MLGAVESYVTSTVKPQLESQGYHFTEKTIIHIEEIPAAVTDVFFKSCNIVGLNPLTRVINQVAISVFVPRHLANRDMPDTPPSA
ncbi:MAG: hypothetical protein KR126chlam6_00690 [Candidatus Anoxychlamydiales bacterium]|nr:hypothetical protein [Candidatus Anoxychlamydiales bacterium]